MSFSQLWTRWAASAAGMDWSLVLEHLYIVLFAVTLSLAVGLPLGLLAYLSPAARKPILWISDLFQTVPSLALL
ncbi:MAG: hypothetical protein LKJ80_07940, partial [Oscillibacter sp.]|nr:hypothetical protein [Oscillibacter sp.]